MWNVQNNPVINTTYSNQIMSIEILLIKFISRIPHADELTHKVAVWV